MSLETALAEIRELLERSPVPEDPIHAENTLKWLLKLEPEADVALEIAALTHDIDRAVPPRTRREDFEDYDQFKQAHARRGAEIVRDILTCHSVDPGIIEEVCRLVERHEFGGDPRSDLLKEADSISYFETNLPLYYEREGWAETLRRAVWGLRRLSERGRKMVREIRHAKEELNRLLDEAFKQLYNAHATSCSRKIQHEASGTAPGPSGFSACR